jgi:hypothetical protein
MGFKEDELSVFFISTMGGRDLMSLSNVSLARVGVFPSCIYELMFLLYVSLDDLCSRFFSSYLT